MKCVVRLAVLFCFTAGLGGVSGQCNRSFSVTTPVQLNSVSIFGSTRPQFRCFSYSYTYTAAVGSSLTLSCSSFSLRNTWLLPGRFGTVSPSIVKTSGTSFPPVTSTSNTLTVQWSSIRNTLPTFLRFLWLQFSFDCVIQPTVASSGICDCGTSTVRGRIVGGQTATEGEFPYQARLMMTRPEGTILCGGSLVSNQWVVTAAHCAPRAGDAVHLGDHSILSSSVNEQLRTAVQVIMHPQYNTFTNINDIALVRLNSPVTFTNYIRPICLPDAFTSNALAGTTAHVTGWGTTSEGGSASDVLQKVTLGVISNAACIATPPNGAYNSIVSGRTICTLTPGKDSCQGDSGGPVAYKTGGKFYLIGVVSNGVGCGRADYPGVNTRVSDPSILQWVKTNAGITCRAP